MIRDGISTKSRRMGSKDFRLSARKEMSFQSLCVLLDHIRATGDFFYLQHLRDPFALMLLLGLKQRVVLPSPPVNSIWQGDISCESVWKALNGSNATKIEGVVKKLNIKERDYLEEIASGGHPEGVTSELCFREICTVRVADFKDVWATWKLQPDPEAISLALLSDFTSGDSDTPVERVTPAVGRFCRPVWPRGTEYDVRFPCCVGLDFIALGYPRYQVHLDCGESRIFDVRGNEVTLDEIGASRLALDDFPDGVFDVCLSKRSLLLIDILCLNDIWMHSRPFHERIQFSWRFGSLILPASFVYNQNELDKARENYQNRPLFVRNLNADYNPDDRHNWIRIDEQDVLQLEVYLERGQGGHWFLRTSDKVKVFEFGTSRISKDERGKVVDVDRDGNILRYRFDLLEGVSFDEVQDVWGIDGEVQKVIGWRKLS